MNCYPREMFVDKDYLNYLTCTIGLGIFNNPVALPCQHVFCKNCIEAWLSKTGTCPKCRENFDKSSLRPQWVFEKIINSALVRCDLCCWTGPFFSFQRHLVNECPEYSTYCSFCEAQLKRKDLENHLKACLNRLIECLYCQARVLAKDVSAHEKECIRNIVKCPIGCDKQMPAREVEHHVQEECEKAKRRCKFGKTTGCTFVGYSEELAKHYLTHAQEHMEGLAGTVISLQEKIEKLEKARPHSNRSQLKYIYIPMSWSKGQTHVFGNVIKGWSFYLSKGIINGPFKARIKITNINQGDGNTWKVCLGVFNSPYFTPGSWGKYKNGWGYILGNGYKINVSAQEYGQPYRVNDTITIEYTFDKKLQFYRNGMPQGIAFSNVGEGPFYLAAALSDVGNGVEIVDVLVSTQ